MGLRLALSPESQVQLYALRKPTPAPPPKKKEKEETHSGMGHTVYNNP